MAKDPLSIVSSYVILLADPESQWHLRSTDRPRLQVELHAASEWLPYGTRPRSIIASSWPKDF